MILKYILLLAFISICYCNSLRQRWNGFITMPGTSGTGSQSFTQTLQPAIVNMNRAFMVASCAYSGESPGLAQIAYQIKNANSVQFEREDSEEVAKCTWYVVEFFSGISVQRGEAQASSSGGIASVSINAVSMSNTFVLCSTKQGGSTWGDDDFGSCRLQSPTQIQFSPLYGDTQYQVVQYTQSFVQHGQFTLGFSTAAFTLTLPTAVDLEKSILLLSVDVLNGESGNFVVGNTAVSGLFLSATQIRFGRVIGANAPNTQRKGVSIAYQVVQFNDDTRVFQSFVPVRNDTLLAEAPVVQGVGLSDLVIGRSVALTPNLRGHFWSYWPGYAGGGTDPGEDRFGLCAFTMDLLLRTPVTLRYTRLDSEPNAPVSPLTVDDPATTSSALVAGYVIEFQPPPPTPPPTAQPTPPPTPNPTPAPTTPPPTPNPTSPPTKNPTPNPTPNPTSPPTKNPTPKPTPPPTPNPTPPPTSPPTANPTPPPGAPSLAPTPPTEAPTPGPTDRPTLQPTPMDAGTSNTGTQSTVSGSFSFSGTTASGTGSSAESSATMDATSTDSAESSSSEPMVSEPFVNSNEFIFMLIAAAIVCVLCILIILVCIVLAKRRKRGKPRRMRSSRTASGRAIRSRTGTLTGHGGGSGRMGSKRYSDRNSGTIVSELQPLDMPSLYDAVPPVGPRRKSSLYTSPSHAQMGNGVNTVTMFPTQMTMGSEVYQRAPPMRRPNRVSVETTSNVIYSALPEAQTDKGTVVV